MEKAVDVLQTVELDALANWLGVGEETNDDRQNCMYKSINNVEECRRRELITRYCKWRGLKRTLDDIAYALEHDMKLKRQAKLVSEIGM